MTLEAQVRSALHRGDLQAAGTAAQLMVDTDPENPAGTFLLGMVTAESGQIARALPLLRKAVDADPCAEYLAQLAKALILLRHDGEAAQVVHRALETSCEEALTLDTIGCVLARLGDHAASLAPFASAVERDPANHEYRFNLAAACGFTGRVEEARWHYEAILAQDPANARVHYALAILSRQTRDDNHVARLEAVLAQARRPEDVLRLRYALAKELEDFGEHDRAFAQLGAANAAHKSAIGYAFARDEAIFDAIEALFEARQGLLFAGPGNDDAAPIFVVGMPRTGTTLVDRILSSHRDVQSTGELQAMPLAVKQAARTPSRTVIDPETIAASGVVDPRVVAQGYLARAAHHLTDGKPRFTDKLPANFLYIGHILQAMPNARIVCLRRHPMDTVWSNVRNLFASQSAYYAYSYDLLDTARYYARFNRLMAFWERCFPGRVLQFGYEGLVEDQEGQTRRLLEYCGLDWDPACLAFHENKAAVATPSAAQVRRTLNRDGIGRWRRHAAGMEQVAAFFADQGIAIE